MINQSSTLPQAITTYKPQTQRKYHLLANPKDSCSNKSLPIPAQGPIITTKKKSSVEVLNKLIRINLIITKTINQSNRLQCLQQYQD